MPRPLAHADHRQFVETEGWTKKCTARSTHKSSDHYRYSLKVSTGEVLSTRVSHGSGSIDDADLVARILRDQLQVTEEAFYRCVNKEEIPPRPAPKSTPPPPDALDGKLVRNLIAKVGMTQSQVALLTKDEAIAAWQEYLTGGGSASGSTNP